MFEGRPGWVRLGGFRGGGGDTRNIGRSLAAALLLGGLIAALAAAPALGRARHVHPDHRRYPVRGIDVSHYQGRIHWPAVARDHVDFAYIKATEGVSSRDPRFAQNWRRARAAGLQVGAYHYFVFCRSGRAQAHNFLAVAPRHTGALPPAVDLETGSRCTQRLRGRDMRRELDAYLAPVEAREHKRAVLYVTPQFYRAYHAYLPRRALWRRSTAAKPDKSWAFWQYHSRGRVAGIRTYVDLNVSGARRHAAAL